MAMGVGAVGTGRQHRPSATADRLWPDVLFDPQLWAAVAAAAAWRRIRIAAWHAQLVRRMDGGVHKHGELVVGVVVQVVAAAAAAAVAGRGQRRLGVVDATDKTGKRTYMSHDVITEDENRARKMIVQYRGKTG